MVMGSEKEIREHSKRTLNQVKASPSRKAKDSTGVFSNNSYNDFAERKFKEFLMSDETGGTEAIFAQVER